MKIINAGNDLAAIPLGRLGENEHTQVVFDVSSWLEEYPDASIGLYYQLPYAADSYPVVISAPVRGKVTWTVGANELQIVGNGKCELVAVKGETVVKGQIWRTIIYDALDGQGEFPEPWESWMTEFTELAGEAQDHAEDSEAWAIGKRNGVPVTEEDPAYENNASFHAEEAWTAALDSAKWATGGTSGQPSEYNNAKHYSEQAAESASAAAGSAGDAAGSAESAEANALVADRSATLADARAAAAAEDAGSASASAGSAAANALKAEGYATGKQNGESVTQDSEYYENNAYYYSEEAAGAALDAIRWTTGGTSGTPSATNNAKYYSEQSEAWATGQTGGTPGAENNAEYWAGVAEQAAEDAQEIIDDTAGDGDTGKTWSANKIFDQLALKAPKSNPVFTGNVRVGSDTSATGENSIVSGKGTGSAFYNEAVSGAYNVPSTIPTENFNGNKVYHKGEFVNFQTYSLVCIVDNTTQPQSSGVPNSNEWMETSQLLEIVGNGYSANDKSNARTLDWNGNERLKGDLYVGANADGTGGSKVARLTDIPDPTDIIDDEAGAGDTDVTFSADKLTSELSDVKSAIASKVDEPSTEGTDGQVLATDGDGGRYWKTVSGGGGGTSDYSDLTNKPQINSVTLSGNKSLSDLGIASATDLAAKYTKPQTGIPASDLSSAVQTSLGKADTALQGQDVTDAVDAYLEENFSNPSNPPLDRSLTSELSAAPADIVGDIVNLKPTQKSTQIDQFVQGSISGTTGVIETEDTTKCHFGKTAFSPGDSIKYNRYNSYITTASVIFYYKSDGTYQSYETFNNNTTITFNSSGMFAIRCGVNNSGTTQQMIDCANQSFVFTTTEKSKIVQAVSDIIAAESSDVGKALSPKTVSNGEITEWQFKPIAVTDDVCSHIYEDYVSGWSDVTYYNTGYIDTDGDVVTYGTNVFWHTDYIEAKENDRVIYNLYGGYGALVTFYNSSKAKISNVTGTASQFNSGTAVAPEGTAYIRISEQHGNPTGTFSIDSWTTLTGDQTKQLVEDYADNITLITDENVVLTIGDVNVVNNSVYKSTGIVDNFVNGRRTDYIPVSPGDTIKYRLWIYPLSPNYQYALTVFNSGKTVIDYVTGEENGFVSGTYTIPSNAEYVMLSWNFDLEKTGWFEISVATLSEKLIDYIARTRKISTSILKGKQWCCMGDSLTNGAATVNPYHMHISERTGITAYNFGMSSTAITKDTASVNHNMATRYLEMFDDVDYVTVFGGTNDHGRNLPIGQWGDATELTLYGAMKILCEGLINKYIGKKIGFLLPCPKCTTSNDVTTDYSYPSESFVPYIECIKNVCARYSIPVLDLYTQSDLHPSIADFRTAMMPDGLHPNTDGMKLLSYRIQSFLESL